MLREKILEEHTHAEAEHDGIGDLHHCGLEVDGEEDVVLLRAVELLREERTERAFAHERGVEDLAGLERGLFLEDDGFGRICSRGR